MLSKRLDDITKGDLEALIANQVTEGKSIEYKRELPGPGNGGSVKILRTLTSFANTNGGHVLYGVEATAGIAIALPGIDSSNEDAVKQRIENLCRHGVQPRLSQVRLHFIAVAEKRSVLVIEVLKSWAAPHRVTLDGHDKFYGRTSADSYPLDVDELRTAFTLSQTVAERARRFRQERLALIAAGDTPVPCPKVGKLVLHVMSMSALTDGTLRALPDSDSRNAFGPIGWATANARPNLDGVVSSNAYPPRESSAYVQLFRSGSIEAVLAFERQYRPDGTAGDFFLPSHWYETHVVKFTEQYTRALDKLGAGPPFFVFLTFMQVKGYRLQSADRWMRHEDNTLERDHMALPDVLLQDMSVRVAPALRPLFDMVWNAFGYERSIHFDDAGELLPKP